MEGGTGVFRSLKDSAAIVLAYRFSLIYRFSDVIPEYSFSLICVVFLSPLFYVLSAFKDTEIDRSPTLGVGSDGTFATDGLSGRMGRQ